MDVKQKDAAPYALDRLIEETRRLAAEFRETAGTMLPVSGEIARYDAARLLGLALCPQQYGYDAVGTGSIDGLRIQIKGRVIGDDARPAGQRIGQLNPDGEWDAVVLSLMDEHFKPLEMYMASRELLLSSMQETSSKRKRRGAMSVAKFRIIGELVWTRELGIIEAGAAMAACR